MWLNDWLMTESGLLISPCQSATTCVSLFERFSSERWVRRLVINLTRITD